MISLFELQTASGQLWLEISAHFAAKDAQIAAITAERDKLAATIADFMDDGADVAKLRGDARRSEKQKRRDDVQAEFDAAKAKLDAAKDALK